MQELPPKDAASLAFTAYLRLDEFAIGERVRVGVEEGVILAIDEVLITIRIDRDSRSNRRTPFAPTRSRNVRTFHQSQVNHAFVYDANRNS